MRRIRTLVPAQFGLLTERRKRGPAGAQQGGMGRPGINQIVGADGECEGLPAKSSGELQPGEAIELRTPGGGGFRTSS